MDELAEVEVQTPDVIPPQFLPGTPVVTAIQDASVILEVGINEDGRVAVLVSHLSGHLLKSLLLQHPVTSPAVPSASFSPAPSQ